MAQEFIIIHIHNHKAEDENGESKKKLARGNVNGKSIFIPFALFAIVCSGGKSFF